MIRRRRGSERRRHLEFRVIRDRVKRDKLGFAAMLDRHTREQGECVLWTGSVCPRGYGRTTIWDAVAKKGVTIHVQRLFLILQLGRPIKLWHEAAHVDCTNSLCVRHVKEQHYTANLAEQATRQGRTPDGQYDEVPF